MSAEFAAKRNAHRRPIVGQVWFWTNADVAAFAAASKARNAIITLYHCRTKISTDFVATIWLAYCATISKTWFVYSSVFKLQRYHRPDQFLLPAKIITSWNQVLKLLLLLFLHATSSHNLWPGQNSCSNRLQTHPKSVGRWFIYCCRKIFKCSIPFRRERIYRQNALECITFYVPNINLFLISFIWVTKRTLARLCVIVITPEQFAGLMDVHTPPFANCDKRRSCGTVTSASRNGDPAKLVIEIPDNNISSLVDYLLCFSFDRADHFFRTGKCNG